MTQRMAKAALLLFSGMTSSVYASDAVDPQALFEEAMQLRESGQVYSSIDIFEYLLSQQPGLNRARLELAVAYRQARRFAEAREALVQVLNDPDTPETVKLSINAYLAQLGVDEAEAKKRTSSSVFVSAGVFNDSNINLGPSPEIQSVSVNEASGSGVTAMVTYSHVSRASKPFEGGDRPIDMEWHSQVTAYTKLHLSASKGLDENDYNLQVISLSTGPAVVASDSWRGAFNIKVDKVYFGNDPYSFNIGLNPSFTLNFSDNLDVTVENLTTVREFSTETGLDGVSKMYGMSVAKFFKALTVGVEGGLRYHSNGAQTGYLNANGIEVFAGGQMPTWKNGRGYLQLSSREYDYKAADPAASSSDPRDETENQAVLGVSHDYKLTGSQTMTVNAQVTYTENDSNVVEYNYDRTVFEINLRSYF